MDKTLDHDFFELLRARGLRKKLAKSIASLKGNSKRNGAAGGEDRPPGSRRPESCCGRHSRPGSSQRPQAFCGCTKGRANPCSKRRPAYIQRETGCTDRAKVARTRATAKAGSRG